MEIVSKANKGCFTILQNQNKGYHNSELNMNSRFGKLAQRLRAQASLPEDLSYIPWVSGALFCFCRPCTDMVHRHSCRQSKHTHKSNKIK